MPELCYCFNLLSLHSTCFKPHIVIGVQATKLAFLMIELVDIQKESQSDLPPESLQ